MLIPCTHPTEVIVCKHVASGEPPELMLDTGPVEFALCEECYAIVSPLVESGREQEAMKHVKAICRECAAALGVPRYVD